MKLNPDTPIGKEQFLIEHNKLSPDSLKVNLDLLNRFKEAKRPELKDAEWSNKLRIPLITWLLTLPLVKKNRNAKKNKE